MPPVSTERLRKEILEYLEETFTKVQGLYLDQGTSLLETLAAVSPEEASARAAEGAASPAAHVRHVAFYLRVLQASVRGEELGKVNWREIWENDRPVSAAEWKALVEELRREYDVLVRFLNEPATWDLASALGGALAVSIHTAYHLGAVRQALLVIRHRGSGASAGVGRHPEP